MYRVLAVSGYRSLRDVCVGLGRLTVVTGPNGSGKSSLYRALRLLADCGQGRVVGALAREGGLRSALWAGPETLGDARRTGRVQGTVRRHPIAIRLGIAGDDLGYLVDLGLPQRLPAMPSVFDHDPQLKREAVWRGPVMRPATLSARRRGAVVELRGDGSGWIRGDVDLPPYRSLLAEYGDPSGGADLWAVRTALGRWRFYDSFRVDQDAPARRPQVATRTFALADDGADLAAALATIDEDFRGPLADAVADAFDGARLTLESSSSGYVDVALHQPGMLRPLRAAEWSDGTLRYLLWLAALMTGEPPPLMVLNEPETSLHPGLLAPLARLLAQAAARTQVVVVTHSAPLLQALATAFPGWGEKTVRTDGPLPACVLVELEKVYGETVVRGQGMLSRPAWEWGRR